MSGRSALVRAKRKEAMGENYPTIHQHNHHFKEAQPLPPANLSFGSIPSSGHAGTLSNDSNIYAWQPIPPQKLRRAPSTARTAGIAINPYSAPFTSTLDKSKLRTKWEDASGSLRNTLGRIVGVGKKAKPSELPGMRRSTSFTTTTVSTNLTSSLAHSGPSSRTSFHHRRVSDHEFYGPPVHAFKGGRKAQPDWESNFVVCFYLSLHLECALTPTRPVN